MTRSVYFLVLSLLFFGCTKTEVYSDYEASGLREELTALRENNATIDDYNQKGDITIFSFSNGDRKGVNNSQIPVLTLGIDGFWRCNGVLTDIPLDTEDLDSIMRRDGHSLGVKEGFEDWAFYFSEEVVSFGKSLFKSNPDSQVRGVNHRGYSIVAPENTLPAFRLSKLNGFHYVEADIRFTLDGVPVLLHDATIDRTSDGSGLVSKLSSEDLQELDFGEWKSSEFIGTKIPSLQEFLALCRDIELCPYLELKTGTRSDVESVISLVKKYGLQGEVIYISFSPSLLEFVVELDPTATIGVLTSTITENVILTAHRLMNGLNYVFIDSSDYSDTAVSMCKNASIPMEVWTIDSKSIIKSLSPYISGVTSNKYHAGRILNKE